MIQKNKDRNYRVSTGSPVSCQLATMIDKNKDRNLSPANPDADAQKLAIMIQKNKDRNNRCKARWRLAAGVGDHDPEEQGSKRELHPLHRLAMFLLATMIQKNKDRNKIVG